MVTETSEGSDRPGYGTVGTALGIGIGALALNVLQNGGLGGVLGGGRPPAGDPPWARDLKYERELTGKDAEIGKLQAQLYTDQQITELRKELTAATAAQAIINTQQTSVIGLLQSQVAQINSMHMTILKPGVIATSEAVLKSIPAAASAANAANANSGSGL